MRRNNGHKQTKPNCKSKCDYKGNGRKKVASKYDDGLDSKSNDPSWYSTDPALLRDAASIPFSWSIGTKLDMGYSKMYDYNEPYVVPGIMTLEVIPCYGRVSSATSALNIAANAIYTFVRHANSGHSNYDAPDLMLYIGAMSQVYSFINWLQRLYGIASLYSQKNRYLPTKLLAANNVKPASIQNNLADFRYRLNLYINKAASLAVPSNMTLFKRHAFLFQNVYCEGSSIKDQLYMYVPGSFMKFDYDTDGAGMLIEASPAGTGETEGGGWTIDELFRGLDQLLDPIISSEDMNIMSGDILKAYGSENLIKLTTVPPDYVVTPVYDLTVLEQFKNATVMLPTSNGVINGLQVKQSANKSYLLSNPYFSTTANSEDEYAFINRCMQCYYSNRLLSTSLAEPGPETVIESTRLMMTVEDKYLDATKIKASADFNINFGSEIIKQCKIYQSVYNSNGTVGSREFKLSYILPNDYSNWTLTSKTGFTPAEKLSIIAPFKFHPAVQSIIRRQTTVQLDGYCFDVDNFAMITPNELDRLHDTALLNMLHVPLISRV